MSESNLQGLLQMSKTSQRTNAKESEESIMRTFQDIHKKKNMQNVGNRKLYGDGFIHMRLTKGTIQWIEVGTRGDWYSCKSDHPLSSGDFRTLPNITPAIAPSHCGKPKGNLSWSPCPLNAPKKPLQFCGSSAAVSALRQVSISLWSFYHAASTYLARLAPKGSQSTKHRHSNRHSNDKGGTSDIWWQN